MKHSLESLPRRIFLDSCTAQTLRDYGGYINADEPIDASDRIHRVTDGIANIEALRNIFLVNERALFEWIVSSGSLHEAGEKNDPGHMQWLWDIADHSDVCLEGSGPTAEPKRLRRHSPAWIEGIIRVGSRHQSKVSNFPKLGAPRGNLLPISRRMRL